VQVPLQALRLLPPTTAQQRGRQTLWNHRLVPQASPYSPGVRQSVQSRESDNPSPYRDVGRNQSWRVGQEGTRRPRVSPAEGTAASGEEGPGAPTKGKGKLPRR